MLDRKSKRLVIDASVAGRQNSSKCLEFLYAVLKICHHAFMTPALLEEWNNHQTWRTAKWRVQMVSRKKWHVGSGQPDDAIRDKLHKQIDADFGRTRYKTALHKDLHLIYAALESGDGIIVSCDKIGSRFARLAQNVGEIAHLVWVDPEEEDLHDWLEKGAQSEKSRTLKQKGIVSGHVSEGGRTR